MLLKEFSKKVSTKSLNESLAKQFGTKIDVSKFTTEQLEDARNKIRTKLSQIETNESFDAVHSSNDYQKNKMFLDIINTAIAEREEDKKDDDDKMVVTKADKQSNTKAYQEFKKGNKRYKAGDDLNEGAEEQSALVMASKDMVDRVTGWMEDTAEMQTESMLEIGDKIRDEMGVDKSEEFIGTVKPALESLFTSLESTRDSLTSGVAILTGEGAPSTMGDEVPDEAEAEEPEMEPTVDDDEAGAETEDPEGDEFATADASAGGEEPADRAKRESVELSRRLGQLLAGSKKKA
ncbi:MAG: hypothetical protein CMC89_05455 [Flavobacteriaceae bacterium]|nr:hypothetical protein [Flavobacteriaceae bacterium]